MIRPYSIRLLVGAAFICLGTNPLMGQATFSVGSSPLTASDIGIADLAGVLTFRVVSGTSVAAPFRIEYSAVITNNLAGEISVTGTGGLAGIAAAPSIDPTKRILIINVPAGGVMGNQIIIHGVRVALAGHSSSTVKATITSGSAGGNAIVVGEGTATVIDRILAPFSVDLSASPLLAYSHGVVINPSTNLVILEGFANAFTNTVGVFGQTVATRIRITPFPGIPAGVQLTFAATATSTESGATINTLSGLAETVPRVDGTTDVVYEFTSVPGSSSIRESFSISITLSIQPPADTGTASFQTALVPIGSVTPDSQFPSTDIPRYAERLVPDEADLVSGTVDLVFPFRAGPESTYTGIALTNPQNFRVRVKLTALDSTGATISGAGISNPVTLTIPRKGQISRLATEIFGASFNVSTPGTIVANGRTSILPGFYLLGEETGPRLDGATADFSPLRNFVFPAVSRLQPLPFTLFEFYNPGTSTANVTLNLYDSLGRLVAARSLSLGGGATANREFSELFDSGLNTFSGGYVTGQSDLPLVTRETFGNLQESNVLAGQTAITQSSFYIAHFAAGGGFTTDLNFVNLDVSHSAGINLTAFDSSGVPLAGANPVKLSIPPGNQAIRAVEDLFNIVGNALRTGYIRVDVDTSNVGPFASIPPVVGFVRFGSPDGSKSASLPLFLPPLSDFVYSHVAQNLEFYTGVAMLNTDSDPVTVSVGVYSRDGSLVGSYSGSLLPGQKIAELIYQLVAAVTSQIGGYIRIQSNRPITSFSLFGNNEGRSLSSIPPQRIDK